MIKFIVYTMVLNSQRIANMFERFEQKIHQSSERAVFIISQYMIFDI